ncbi:M23 family metallopeptidase [uncultured Oscillibacter sp.]|uniref:M23 family metallopeptidase n=1 Tax=uncultured Oscillibacter sp. TaxID=876091 RepID=UPI002613019F|nr:M23 family metallopeptidase [uncultured Oscillibacter sp.]
MKKRDYQNLMEHIQPPAGLNDRVLSAARQQAAETGKQPSGPKRLAPGKRRPVLRAAVCAACALALVVGSVTLGPIGGGETVADGAPVTALPALSFGLTAYAADTGERYEANANGGLAFSTAGQGSWSAGDGHYTGCLFQVTGENIRTISLAIDREALYRSRTLTDLSREEVQNYLEAEANGTEYRLPNGEGVINAVYSDEEEGALTMEVVTDLGAAVTEGYDPEVRYGFLIPDTGDIDWDGDPRAANQESIDRLDGARLTVTVTFTDGSEQTKTYTLSTGRLKVEYDANSPGGTLLPQLAGDEDPWLYGVYVVDETASRFLQWPVEGANTISLSNPYGTPRWQPGGETYKTHTGIDIAAPEDQAVLAAAGGTVVEFGYDVERGNYVVIDHGDGLFTLYGQCRDFTVEEGDTVRAGEMIGAVGKTGMATGAHLHFEVRQDGEPQNPVAYFDSDVRDTLRMG